MLHIYSDVHLRSEFGLSDGDRVTIRLASESLAKPALLHEIVFVLRMIRRRALAPRKERKIP